MTAHTFTLDATIDPVWQANILSTVDEIDDLMDGTWTRLAIGPADAAFVPWDGFMTLPGAGALVGAAAGAIVYPTAAYVSAQVEIWGSTTWLHEFGGHVVAGLADRPGDPGDVTLMGYQGPTPTGLTADVVKAIQDRYGPDSGDNSITLTGTDGGRISGGHGSDTISGADGADLVYGNQQGDVLFGNGGSDTLYGGQDADLLSGGADADVLYGNLGSDTLIGGDGLDVLYGGQGGDIIHAGPGDTVIGGLGADEIWAHPLSIIGQVDPNDIIHEWSFV